MRCEDVRLIELLRAELPESDCESVIDHVESCTTCQERLRVMMVLDELSDRETGSNRRRQYRLIGLAAAVAFLCFLPLFLIPLFQPASTEYASLATTEPYPYFPLTVRSLEDSPNPLRDRAFRLYSEGAYQAAAIQFCHLPKEPENNFFLGVSLYLAGEDERALESLLEVIQGSPRWAEAARWYSANIYLRQAKPDLAIEALDKVILEGNEFVSEAQGLKAQLEDLGVPGPQPEPGQAP